MFGFPINNLFNSYEHSFIFIKIQLGKCAFKKNNEQVSKIKIYPKKMFIKTTLKGKLFRYLSRYTFVKAGYLFERWEQVGKSFHTQGIDFYNFYTKVVVFECGQ